MIKSVSYDQEEIISSIIKLHIPSGVIDCDPTYGKGNFYKKINPPFLKFDIDPINNSIAQADAINLPLADKSLNSIMFDPPFLATKGASLKKNDGSNTINKRFGVFPTEIELVEFYDKAIVEFHRILDKKGILIFKCQDKVSSGKQYFNHCYIYNSAVESGFYPLDFFVLTAKNRLVADWQKKNQKHARKFHCYFWVFQKVN